MVFKIFQDFVFEELNGHTIWGMIDPLLPQAVQDPSHDRLDLGPAPWAPCRGTVIDSATVLGAWMCLVTDTVSFL